MYPGSDSLEKCPPFPVDVVMHMWGTGVSENDLNTFPWHIRIFLAKKVITLRLAPNDLMRD